MTSLRASGASPPRGSGTSWIVCAGATRDVSDGRVQCPGHGVVEMGACLVCHLLVTCSAERNLRVECSTGEWQSAPGRVTATELSNMRTHEE